MAGDPAIFAVLPTIDGRLLRFAFQQQVNYAVYLVNYDIPPPPQYAKTCAGLLHRMQPASAESWLTLSGG
jgi:hypothetical protein